MTPRPLLALSLAALVMSTPTRAQLIVAHRGASHDAPENTLAAFRLAYEQGADGAEGDFYLTKDGQIACIHDADTKRTTGGAAVLKVADTTLADLRKLDVGSWKNPRYAGEKIPTLDEALAVVPPGKLFFIEIKCGPEILPALEEAIARAKVKPDQLRIISFKEDVITAARKRFPHIKAHWISSYKTDKKTGAVTPTHEQILATLKRSDASGFNSNANLKQFTPDFVTQLKSAGLETQAWTVDDPAVARELQKMGVYAITTNRPAWLREQLKK